MSSPVKVFISYSHDSPEHIDRVLTLADKLRAAGVDAILDQYEPNPSEGWPRWTEREIEAADFVLMICTETYLRRVSGQEKPGVGQGVIWEANIIYQSIYAQSTYNDKFIPVLFEPINKEHIPVPLQGVTHYQLDAEEEYTALYRRLTDQPEIQKPALGSLHSLPPRDRKQDFFASRQDSSTVWNVPYERNNFFTGRDKELEQIRLALIANSTVAVNQTQAIYGLGGIGKTQLAVEYAYRHRSEYKAVFWVRAETELEIQTGYLEMARLLNLAEKDAKEVEEVVRAVKRWLEQNEGWLMIYDNADHPGKLKSYRPMNARGRTLITSRAQNFDKLGKLSPIEVNEMPPMDAVKFLFTRTQRDESNAAEREAAKELATELGYLPLALEQAGAFISEKKAKIRDYLKSYRKRRMELLNEAKPVAGDYPQSVATTWKMNFDEVEKESSAATELLRVSAYLSPDSIPFELIKEGRDKLGVELSAALVDVEDDPLAFSKVLEPLIRYSLIRCDINSDTYSMHRLVQEVLREEEDKDKQRQRAETVVRVVNTVFPDAKYESWGKCERLLEQARRAAELVDKYRLQLEEAGRLLNQVGYYYDDRGQYAPAEPVYKRSLSIFEEVLGEDHPNVATSLNNLALLYDNQGRYEEAEPLYKKSLGRFEEALGEDHPDVATSLNNLALLYKNQGRYAEAEPLLKRSLSIYEQTLGENHPSVATSLNNLAVLYRNQGRYEEAEPLFKRSLSIRELKLVEDHPHLATSLNDLALLYKNQGKYEEAESLYKRSLSIYEQTLGENHPSVATSLNNLANLYNSQGKYAEAEPLYIRSLSICEQTLGEIHPNVALFLDNYAGMLREMQRDAEAEEMFARAKNIRDEHARRNRTE